MSLSARVLASGPGWSVSDVICTAGPHDRPFEERHEAVSIAAVTAGTFQYRTASGRAVLARHCRAVGRDPATLRRSLMVPVAIGRTPAEIAARRARIRAKVCDA